MNSFVNSFDKIRYARKLLKAVNKVRKSSKKWLCSACKKSTAKKVKEGSVFFELLLDAEKNFCSACAKEVNKELSAYKEFKIKQEG